MFDPEVNKDFHAQRKGRTFVGDFEKCSANFRAGPALLRWYTLKL